MSARAYSVVTAYRASNLVYEIAIHAPPGIWVIPDNVCPAVPLALACAGAELRFVDIDAETLCLDTRKVADLAKAENIAGVVYVRTYGANTPAQNDLAELRKTLPKAVLIDDRCIGVPQTDTPENNGAADVVLFSTGYGKVLDLGGGAYGFFKTDMGFKLGGRTLSSQAFEDLLSQSNAAMKTGNPVLAGFDFTAPAFSTEECPSFQGWSNLSQSITNQLPDRLTHKAQLNAIYAEGLSEFAPLADSYLNWRFHIFVQNPTQTVAALFGAGLFASKHYAPVSRLWGVSSGQVAQKTAKNIINLFNDQHFAAKQARQAVRIIKKVGKPL